MADIRLDNSLFYTPRPRVPRRRYVRRALTAFAVVATIAFATTAFGAADTTATDTIAPEADASATSESTSLAQASLTGPVRNPFYAGAPRGPLPTDPPAGPQATSHQNDPSEAAPHESTTRSILNSQLAAVAEVSNSFFCFIRGILKIPCAPATSLAEDFNPATISENVSSAQLAPIQSPESNNQPATLSQNVKPQELTPNNPAAQSTQQPPRNPSFLEPATSLAENANSATISQNVKLVESNPNATQQPQIVERIVERFSEPTSSVLASYVQTSTLQSLLNDLETRLNSRISSVSQSTPALAFSGGGAAAPIFSNTFGLSQKIDQLSGTSLSNITVSDVSGLTDSDIPDDLTASNYLPLSGGTLSGDLSLGGTLTANTLAVSGVSSGGAVEAPYFTATSTIATSTFAGGLAVGTNALTILQNGKVGIGTTSPETQLQVAEQSGTTNLRISNASDAPAQIQFFNNHSLATSSPYHFGIAHVYNPAAGKNLEIRRLTASGGFSSLIMQISQDGRVGIGSQGTPIIPETRLAVVGENTTSSQLTLRSLRTNLTSGHVVGGIDLNSNDSNLTSPSTTAYIRALAAESHTSSALGTGLALGVTPTGSASPFEAMRLDSSGNLGIGTTSPYAKLSVKGAGTGTGKALSVSDSNDIERLTVLDNGNVGIGTTNPLAKLHSGMTISDYASLDFSTTGALISATTGDQDDAESNVLSLMRDGTSGVVYASAARFDMSRWQASGFNARTKLDIKLAHNATDDLVSVLTMQSNGNVGIGTTSPFSKLSVAGDIFASGDMYGNIAILDTRSTSSPPTTYDKEIAFDFKHRATLGAPGSAAYGGLITIAPWGDNTGGKHTQLFLSNDGISYRQGSPDSASWDTWYGAVFSSNVGIGTTSPYARLSIKGAGTGTGKALAISNSNDIERLTVLDSGNVGIGTVAPSDKLEISDGNIRLSSMASGIHIGPTSGNRIRSYTQEFEPNLAFGTRYPMVFQTVTTGAFEFIDHEGNSLAAISGSSAGSKAYFAGNFGIGTISPYAKLSIKGTGTGTGKALSISDSNDIERLTVLNNGNIQLPSLGSGVLFGASGNNRIRSYAEEYEPNLAFGTRYPMVFQTVTTGAFEFIDHEGNSLAAISGSSAGSKAYFAGNFGIGTTSPYAKLSVKGSGTGTGKALSISDSNDIERLTVLDNGNVGIGTISPGAKLQLDRAADDGILVRGDISGEAWDSHVALVNTGSPGTVVRLGFKDDVAGHDMAKIESSYAGAGGADSSGTLTFFTRASGGSWNAAAHVDASGNVGIGTTSPTEKLQVHGNIQALTSSTGQGFFGKDGSGNSVFSFMRGENSNGSNRLHIQSNSGIMLDTQLGGGGGTIALNGNVGIASTSPWAKLSVSGTVAFAGLTGSTGAGSLCLDSNNQVVYNAGSDACLSSTRDTKHDIQALDLSALSVIDALESVSFVYNEGDGRTRYGFIAEDTAAVDAPLATYNASGTISGIDDRAILSVVVKAIKELATKVTDLATTVGNFANRFTTRELCVEDVCVTREQFAAVFAAGAPATSAPAPQNEQDEPTTPAAIEIVVQGNNPAELLIGDEYTDLGAIASSSDPALVALGVRTFQNDIEVSSPTIETDTAAEHEILYRVLGGDGETLAEASRTVIVSDPAPATPDPDPSDPTDPTNATDPNPSDPTDQSNQGDPTTTPDPDPTDTTNPSNTPDPNAPDQPQQPPSDPNEGEQQSDPQSPDATEEIGPTLN